MSYPYFAMMVIIVLLALPGCATHPGYWSEESCEYCIQQNEHFSRVYKDQLTENKLKRLERRIKELECQQPKSL